MPEETDTELLFRLRADFLRLADELRKALAAFKATRDIPYHADNVGLSELVREINLIERHRL